MDNLARLALEEKPLGDEGVEVAPNCRGRNAELLTEGGSGLRSALQDETGHSVAGATLADIALEFHNISMTYFAVGGSAAPKKVAYFAASQAVYRSAEVISAAPLPRRQRPHALRR